MAFIFLVAVLPLHLISPADWGTETEAIRFAEDVVHERLEHPKDEKNDWAPMATKKQPLPPLNQEKRFWNVVGKVAADSETTRKYHVSACKEPTGQWALVGIHVDDRIIYFDKNILEPTPMEWYDDPAA